jgi:hypothetical protein
VLVKKEKIIIVYTFKNLIIFFFWKFILRGLDVDFLKRFFSFFFYSILLKAIFFSKYLEWKEQLCVKEKPVHFSFFNSLSLFKEINQLIIIMCACERVTNVCHHIFMKEGILFLFKSIKIHN